MTPERWHQINDVLDAVMDLLPPKRAAYLDMHHPDDPTLRDKVMELVAAYGEVDSFLEDPIAGYVTPLVTEPETPAIESRRVGPYRLLGRIARGGMGTVYLAARDDEQYRKKVAVKLIRRGMDTDDVLRRFLAERQILAQLEHPNIARLLDGGVTDDGRPFFVMEYVEGQPIDHYCDVHCLSIAERLRLFLRVCEAVRYAHSKLVVHRDLKPSNILVAEDGTVKLLDFGIAKLLSDDGGAPVTRTGMRVMTPEYAAPEQVRGEAVTTATDVYALGVLLYKLLTGRLPYRVRGVSPHEFERAILDTEPTRPSTAVTRVGADEGEDAPTPEAISRDRGLSVSALRRRLSGDLDTIVLKALKKESERRYASVEAFEEDARRYLAGLPVWAHKDTVWYRATKFTRRHRLGVAATVLFLVMTISYAVTTGVQAKRVTLERDKAEQVIAFMVDLFKVSDPGQARGDTMTVREVLERGAARIEKGLAEQPAVQAQMMVVISEVYQNLGLYDAALPLAEQALTLRQAIYGEEHPEVAASLYEVAGVLDFKGEYHTADSLFREVLALRRKLLGDEHLDVAQSLNGLGLVLSHKSEYDVAEPALREALALRRKLLGDDHLLVAESMHHLGAVLNAGGAYDEAEALLRQALALRRKLLDDDHPDLAASLVALADVLYQTDAYDEAEALLREALVLRRKILGADHPDLATSLLGIARLLQSKGDYNDAEALLREGLVLRRSRLGDDHPQVAASLEDLGQLLRVLGNYEEAEPLYREALAIWRKVYGEKHLDVAISLHNFARLLQDRGNTEEAVLLMREALAIYQEAFGDHHPGIATIEYNLASMLLPGKEHLDEAEARFRHALEIRRTVLGEKHRNVSQSIYGLATALDAKGAYEEALPLYQEALAGMREAWSEEHPRTAFPMVGLGEIYLKQDRPQEAEPLLRQALSLTQKAWTERHWQPAQAMYLLGKCLMMQERYDEAGPLLIKSVDILREKLGGRHNLTRSAIRQTQAFYTTVGEPQKAAEYQSMLAE